MEQFLVVGLGRFGKSITKTLYEKGATVLAIDKNDELVQDAINNNILDNGVIVDATDLTTLKNLGIHNFDVAFVCIGSNIQDSILVALLLKEIGIKKVIAKAHTEAHGKVLKKIGVDEIVFPETEMGRSIALRELEPNMIEHMKFSDGHILVELRAPKKFINRSLMELELRKRYHVNVIGIKKISGDLVMTPLPDTIIKENDTLMLIANVKTIKELEELE